jgi:hypothetical protein
MQVYHPARSTLVDPIVLKLVSDPALACRSELWGRKEKKSEDVDLILNRVKKEKP